MKIYFTGSSAGFANNRKIYAAVRKYLVENNHILTRDWIPEAENVLDQAGKKWGDMKYIYKACIEAIKEAQLVIIEDTFSNFSTGHQITVALQQRKPTLVLWGGKKQKQFNHMFIHGIESDLLQVSDYSEKNLLEIIQIFINKYQDVSERNRFHLVLNAVERTYLDWSQFVKNKSRTKVVREAIREKMEKDEEYKKYLFTKNT